MNVKDIEVAQRMIEQMPVGEQKCLSEIYGDSWTDITNPTDFGKHFKQAVKEQVLINLKHIGIRSTGRCDEYEKL